MWQSLFVLGMAISIYFAATNEKYKKLGVIFFFASLFYVISFIAGLHINYIPVILLYLFIIFTLIIE